MKTTEISLFYNLTPKAIVPPAAKEVERKDRWIKALQVMIPSEWQPFIIKVTYRLFNPEIENMVKFFNGVIVLYYAIQNMELTDKLPASKIVERYREDILDEMLGYDYHTMKKVLRKRTSTATFKDVQTWNTFINQIKEEIFDPAGYDFPDSEKFWELAKQHSYDEAKRISIERLQKKILANKPK